MYTLVASVVCGDLLDLLIKYKNFLFCSIYLNSFGSRLIKSFFFFSLQSNSTVLETEMFANYLEAIVETILPIEEGETAALSDFSTSTSMITLASPVDKGNCFFTY